MTEKPKILIVDDDELMRWIVEEALGDGYRAICADCGEAALTLAAAEAPDAIVLDVDLPGISGYETCRRLKAVEATAGIPVIFVSGSESAANRSEGFAAGGADFILKPAPPEVLQVRLAQLIER